MHGNLIFYYIILGILVVSAFITIYLARFIYTTIITVLIIIFSVLVFGYVWREKYNVYPDNKSNNKSRFRNKVIWVNVDKLDILNDSHVKWAKNLLIKEAPNKLGIYSDKYNVTKLDILRYKETFFELFGYDSEYIYFENAKLNKKTKDFCKEKNIKINKISLRIN